MQRKFLVLVTSLFMLILGTKGVFAETIRPDTVPDWYPAETCMNMMDVLVDEYSLTPEGAASVLGNVCQESRFQAQAYSGYYTGVCQWEPSRWAMITNWIYNNCYSTDDSIAQLRAAFEDAENGSYSETLEYMKTVESIEDGVHRWLVYYEGAPGQQEAERISFAYDALEIYNAN